MNSMSKLHVVQDRGYQPSERQSFVLLGHLNLEGHAHRNWLQVNAKKTAGWLAGCWLLAGWLVGCWLAVDWLLVGWLANKIRATANQQFLFVPQLTNSKTRALANQQ